MKILCCKSGIEFKCDHIPVYLSGGESHHPIFDMSLKQLWKLYPKWLKRELTRTDSFLLFLAYLNATELVEFRCHVWQRPNTDSIVANNMTGLYEIIGKIVTIKHPKFAVPRFVISHDTRDLENVRYWIEAWENSFEDFCNGLKGEELRSRLQRKAETLERYIKNVQLDPRRYARILAQWANEAGQFPENIAEYWEDIIVKCHTSTDIITIPKVDLEELIEYCEENVDAGSIQGHHLFQTIREGYATLTGFFSVGSPTFSILDSGDDVGQTNLQLLVQSAPIEEPKRADYPTEFAFIKARMKWKIAQGTQS